MKNNDLPADVIESARSVDLVQLVESYGIQMHKQGKDYFGLCCFHSEDTPSLTIYRKGNQQRYHCMGCGADGDAIQFVRDYEGLKFRDAVKRILGELPASGNVPTPAPASMPAEPEEVWTPIIPIPDSAPNVPDLIRRKVKGQWISVKASRRWDYFNADGEPIGYVFRYDMPSGGKEVVPTVWAVSSLTGECQWRNQAFPKPRPIYGLERLAANPTAQVMVVEGEKACDAARQLFLDRGFGDDKIVVVSWPGGGKAVKHVDWSPLGGRAIALWPDADKQVYPDKHEKAGIVMPFVEQPGTVAMLDLCAAVKAIATRVRLILPPEGVDDGWDLADDFPNGFDMLKHIASFNVDPAALMPAEQAVSWETVTESELSFSGGFANETARSDETLEVACNVPDVLSPYGYWAHLPSHKYISVSTGELWPSASVNGYIPVWPLNPRTNKPMQPSDWLDRNRAVEQMSWHPGRPQIIENEVMLGGGWSPRPGARVYNLYRVPDRRPGNPEDVAPWLNHLRTVYPEDWEHILSWLAHRIQRPGEKINHALVLGGRQGIGKDTILEPVKMGVGSCNWSEVGPLQVVKDQFNPWVRSVVARISELRDLKEDRFSFYETMKAFIAAPPDTLRVNQKHVPEYYVPNVMGVIFTTNNSTDGLYLPAEDRRHYVAWSDCDKEQFDAGYWDSLWNWIKKGGGWNVVEYLTRLDLSGFNCKAPPERTNAFWAIVHANSAPEDIELSAVLGHGDASPQAVVLEDIIAAARAARMDDLAGELRERKSRRSIPHKLARAGYTPAHNPDAKDGLWSVAGKRVTIYVKMSLTRAEQLAAARKRVALGGPLF